MNDDRGHRLLKFLFAGAALILLLLAARGLVSSWMSQRLASTVERLERSYGPLDPGSLNRPPVPDDENRALVIRAAMEAMVLDGQTGRHTRLLRQASKMDGDTLEKHGDALREIMAHNSEALTALRDTIDRPHSNWSIEYEKGVRADIPDLMKILDLGRLVAVQALLQAERGDVKDAVDTVESGFAISASLTGEQVIVVQMVRIGLNMVLLRATKGLLERRDLDDGQLLRLQRSIESTEVPGGIAGSIVGELKAVHGAFDALESGHYINQWGDPLVENGVVRWVMMPVTRSDHEYYLRVQERMVEYAHLSVLERRDRFAGHPLDVEVPWWRPYAAVTLPNLGDAVERGDIDVTRLSLARTVLALRRHRLRSGAWPRSLRELVPEALAALPADPFTGDAFVYESRGKGCAVRSAGADLKSPPDPLLIWTLPE